MCAQGEADHAAVWVPRATHAADMAMQRCGRDQGDATRSPTLAQQAVAGIHALNSTP